MSHIVDGRDVEWGKTSADYARHRPGPPPSFYKKLKAHGVGLPGQRILDIGTGTGVLARTFALQGAHVSATDLSDGQITMAQELAAQQGVEVDFRAAPGSQPLFPDDTFDVVTASQCWWYFDHAKLIPEIQRILKPGGRLVICQFCFVPREDAIVAASEKLVLKYNPDWSGADWDGQVPITGHLMPDNKFLNDQFVYDEHIPFTRESWRGRMRALRGMSASLPPETVAGFDAEHEAMLASMAGETFTILHRIDAWFYQFDEAGREP